MYQLLTFMYRLLCVLGKKLQLNLLGGDEENTFDDTEEDADWHRLFESAKSGQPVEAMGKHHSQPTLSRI